MKIMLMNQPYGYLNESYFGRSVEDIVSHDFFSSFDANIHALPDHYLIEVAVPGFRKKDLSIHITDGILLVSASKEERVPERVEFSYTSFNRSFVLPPDADANRVKATCRDGLLRIKIRRTVALNPGRIIPISGDISKGSWWSSIREKIRKWFGR
jgi:Molecular chaperone (small heat shock protein)